MRQEARKFVPKTTILKRDNYLCQYCGQDTTGIDHIIPANFKDDASPKNLVTCCSKCNSIGGHKIFKDFLDKKTYILSQRLKKKLGIKNPGLFPAFVDRKEKESQKKLIVQNRIQKQIKNMENRSFFNERKKMNKSISQYKYHRNCLLETCKKLFGTNYKRKEFCKDTHRIIYHEVKRRKRSVLYKRMMALEMSLKQAARELDQAMTKAVRNTGRMADLLSPKKGGNNNDKSKKQKGSN